MSTNASTRSTGKVDMKLEVVVIPVSDMDRATEFYKKLGWRQDVTPPGSGCSVQFGANRTSAAPGSAQGLWLIVSDIQAAIDKLSAAGVQADEVFHIGANGKASGLDPERNSYRSFRLVPRSGRQPLAVPGDHDTASRAHRPCRDFVRLRERPGERDAACGGSPRRARETHRAARRELGRLVRGVHGGGAGRRETAGVRRFRRDRDRRSRYLPHTSIEGAG